MIGLPTGTRIWLVAGITDMRRGFDGLAAIVQEHLAADSFGGKHPAGRYDDDMHAVTNMFT